MFLLQNLYFLHRFVVISASPQNPEIFRSLVVYRTCQTSGKSAEQEHVSKYHIIITIYSASGR